MGKYIAVAVPYYPLAEAIVSALDSREEKTEKEVVHEVGPLINQTEIIPFITKVDDVEIDKKLNMEPEGKAGYRYRRQGRYDNSHRFI